MGIVCAVFQYLLPLVQTSQDMMTSCDSCALRGLLCTKRWGLETPSLIELITANGMIMSECRPCGHKVGTLSDRLMSFSLIGTKGMHLMT